MLIIEEKHKKQQVVNKKVCYFSFGELSMLGSVFSMSSVSAQGI